MRNLCKMLSRLSVDRIAKTQEATDLYHQLTIFIDNSRKRSYGVGVLNNPRFWETYFRFYHRYWSTRMEGDEDE